MTHDNIDILVVDDDISHCTILQALLRGWGYNVALANQRATGAGAGAGTGF